MRIARLLLLTACGAATPGATLGQRVTSLPAGPRVPVGHARVSPAGDLHGVVGARAGTRARGDSSWWVPLASALLPGTGQALLRQDRFVAYLAAEAFALFSYFNEEIGRAHV